MTEPWNDPEWTCTRCGTPFASDSPYYPPAVYGTDDEPLCLGCADRAADDAEWLLDDDDGGTGWDDEDAAGSEVSA